MFFLISSIFITVANIFLGTLVYLRNPKSKSLRYFLMMSIALALWTATLYLYYTLTESSWVLLMGRLNFAAPTMAAYYFFLFVYEFAERQPKLPRFIVTSLSFLAYAMAIVVAATPLVDQNEIVAGASRIVVYGKLYPVWMVYFGWLIALGLFVLISRRLKAKGVEKTQLRYLVVGMTIAFLWGMIANVLLPFGFGDMSLQMTGPIGTLGITGFTAFVILRHRFLDMSTLIGRTVLYTFLVILIVLLEAVFLWLATTFLPGDVDRVVVAVVGSVIMVLGYDILRGFLAKVTDRIFYQGKYSTEAVLSKLTKIMASEIRIEYLANDILTTLSKEMRLTGGALVLLNGHKPHQVFEVGMEKERLYVSSQIDLLAHATKASLVLDEVEDGEVKAVLRKLGVAAALPMRLEEEEVGVLLVGPKESGDIFFDQDMELLELLAPQAAVAVKNAESYREIAEFSKTLEKKVEERTAQLEAVQKQELARAKELLKIKDEFVFIASHDLATPVTAISGYMSLIKDSKEKLSADMQENLDAIAEAGERLKELVDDLLQVARSEAGTIRVEIQPVEVNGTIVKAVELIKPKADERKIAITTELDGESRTAMADPDKLAEVLENLLSNAVKYNKEGGSIVIATRIEGKKLILSVADTGIGIPKAEQDKVFSRFFRSEERAVRAVPGTGLGLFVVRMLVEKMGGSIRFESTEGTGTKFFISLLTS